MEDNKAAFFRKDCKFPNGLKMLSFLKTVIWGGGVPRLAAPTEMSKGSSTAAPSVIFVGPIFQLRRAFCSGKMATFYTSKWVLLLWKAANYRIAATLFERRRVETVAGRLARGAALPGMGARILSSSQDSIRASRLSLRPSSPAAGRGPGEPSPARR